MSSQFPGAASAGSRIHICETGPDYIKAAGIQLVEGRFIDEQDSQLPDTIAVINETAAHTYFPGENPLGKKILAMNGPSSSPHPESRMWKTVVGVVADTKNDGLNQPPAPQTFVNGRFGEDRNLLLFLVRSLADESALASALHEEMRAQHPGMFTEVESLNRDMNEMTAGPRFNTVLLGSFAAIALLMAVVGVYGLLAFSVAQRRQEIGIRMALGASPGNVLALVMREGALLVGLGAFIGLAAAFGLTRYIASLLYGVRPTDGSTYALVVLVLIIAGLLASLLPAKKAAVADPLVALRHE